MSAPADTCSIPVRTAGGAIVDLVLRPGFCDSPEAFAELVEMLRAELPAGWTLVEVES